MPDVLVSVSFYFRKKDCNKSVYVMDGDCGIDELCVILLQTINDVLMGIIGAGLHQYLEGHHKDVANADSNFLTVVPLIKFVSYSTTCKPILVLMRLSTTELICTCYHETMQNRIDHCPSGLLSKLVW
jgi:hypothetical protein